MARQDLLNCATEKPGVVVVDRVKRLSIPRQKNMMRYWSRSLNLPSPDSRQLAHVVSDVIAARHDSSAQVRWKGAELQRCGNYIHLAAPLEEFDISVIREWNFTGPLSPGIW